MNRAISTQQDSTEAQESRAPGAGKKSSPNKGGGRNNGAHRRPSYKAKDRKLDGQDFLYGKEPDDSNSTRIFKDTKKPH
jgi:hypothetical protein